MEDDQEDFFYTLTPLKPSVVSKCTVGSFLGAGEINLVKSKNVHLAVDKFENNKLHAQCDLWTCLRVREISTVKTMFPVDLIFLVLDVFFVVAAFNFETKQLRPLYREKILALEDAERKDLVFAMYNPLDPITKRFSIGYSVDGVLSLLQFEMDLAYSATKGLYGSIKAKSSDFTTETGDEILDLLFMEDGTSVALLLRNYATGEVSVKSYGMDIENSKLIPGLIHNTINDKSTCLLAPCPIQEGVMSIGLREINYFKPNRNKLLSISEHGIEDEEEEENEESEELHNDGQQLYDIPQVNVFVALDIDLFICGDASSRLFLIQVDRDEEGEVKALQRINLGDNIDINCCVGMEKELLNNVMTYFAFIGESKSDSHFITVVPSNSVEDRICFEQTFKAFYANNIALDDSDPYDTTIIGCNGKDGYLNILKNGSTVTEHAKFEQEGVKAIFSIRKTVNEEYHQYLFFSFVGHTRIMNCENDITETFIDSVDPDTETIYLGNVDHNFILHVVPDSVRLLNGRLELASNWKVPTGSITIAEATPSQAVIGQGKNLYYFKIEEEGLQLIGSKMFSEDVAHLTYGGLENHAAKTVLVALWQTNNIQIVSLTTLQSLYTIHIDEGPEAVIRCLAVQGSDMMVGLGDGRIVNFEYDVNSTTITKRRTYSIGSTQAHCVACWIENQQFFFVCTDKPVLVLNDELGLRVAPVYSSTPVDYICPFKSQLLECWAFVTIYSSEVKVISLNDFQRLNSTKFDMNGYIPYDVDFYSPLGLYAVLSLKEDVTNLHLINVNLPVDNPQNQYSFMINIGCAPRCVGYVKLKHCVDNTIKEYIAAVINNEESSVLTLYRLVENGQGIFVLEEYQSIEMESKVIKMKEFQNMLLLCCIDSINLVRINRNDDIELTAQEVGQVFSNVAIDEENGIVAPLSLSTDIDVWKITWDDKDEASFTAAGSSLGYNCPDLPLQAAFLKDSKQVLVTGSLSGQVHFHSFSQQSRFNSTYNLSDRLNVMKNTSRGSILGVTNSGAIWACKLIAKSEYDILIRIQSIINQQIPMLASVPHDALRFNYSNIDNDGYIFDKSFKSNIIEGDFISRYLTSNNNLRNKIARELKLNPIQLSEMMQSFNQDL